MKYCVIKTPNLTVFHSSDFGWFSICYTGIHKNSTNASLETVAICGGYITRLTGLYQSGDFPSQSPQFRGAKYITSPVRQVRYTASCGFMVDPCGAPWWPLRCNGLDALSAPYVYVVISPNMPSHIPTEWDPLHTKHSISLQSPGPSEKKMMKMLLLS